MTISNIPALPESIAAAATVDSPHHHLVESFHMKDGTHLRDVRLDFADGLNVIIGARGSGKTTIIQNLRHSVGTSATGPRAARNDDLVTGTLGNGRVTTRVRTRHGVQYVASRGAVEPSIVTDADGVLCPVSLDSELFRIEVYSQKEIESMAENPAAQLALIDKFAEAEIRDHNDAIGRVDRQLTLNGAALTRLEADIEELGTRTRDLPTVTAALASLTDAAGPDADGVRHARDARLTRGRESAVVSGAHQELRATLQRLDAFDMDAKRRLEVELPAGLDKSPNRALMERVETTMRAARTAVASAVTRARGTLVDVETGLSAAVAALGLAHAGQAAIDEQLTRQHDADAGRAAERERLQRRFLELEQFEKRLLERRREHEALAAQRQDMRHERSRLLSARFAVRVRVGNELTRDLDGDIRVSIRSAADREAYGVLLCEIVKGAHLRVEHIRELARQIPPHDLVALALVDNPVPLEEMDDSKTGRPERAQRFLTALRVSGRLRELDTVPVADVPLLELRIGERYQPSDKVSAGQSCTAVLPILLLQSAAPLLIDEPEHCLDNSFIYDVLVVSLLRIKKARQLIFVSHNPNIPVLAEAERVFVMDETDGVGRVLEYGTVDEVRGSIERLLEGGREAFLRRSVRYGHRLGGGDS